jgi:hypothetical protein
VPVVLRAHPVLQVLRVLRVLRAAEMFPAQRATVWAGPLEARAVQAGRAAPPAVRALSRAAPVRLGLLLRRVPVALPVWRAMRAKVQSRAKLVLEAAMQAQREETLIPAKARSSVTISKQVKKAHCPRVGRCPLRATVRPWDSIAHGS